MDPVVSVGSLGSYVTGLSRALQRKGNLVEVILPKYKSLNLTEVQGLQDTQAEFYSYFNGQLHVNKIWTGQRTLWHRSDFYSARAIFIIL